MNVWVIATAAVAGGIGAGLRYLLDAAIMRRRHGRFPLGILIVNITGSFALGLVVGLGSAVVSPEVATIVGTGLLGGYTTFSTVSVESMLLLQRGRRRAALGNLLGTLVVALAAAALGVLGGAALAGVLSS
jgi:CrcB protein